MMLVLFAVAVAMVLSMGFLAAQTTTTGIAQNLQNQSVARQIAETGLAATLAKVKADANWRTTFTHGAWTSNASFLGGALSISGEDGKYDAAAGAVVGDGNLKNNQTDPLTITAIGNYKGATFVSRGLVTTTTTNLQTVLMIVVNDATLTAGETARKTFLESKGWTVAVVSQTAGSSDLDEALDEADVVYIPSTITSTSLATHMDSQATGVVCEAGAFNKVFGLASAAGTATTQSVVNVVNNTHYITKGMATGSTTVTTSPQPQFYIGGIVATGGTVLIRSNGRTNPALLVLEEGALLQGGGTAPARRVALPWGATAFDFGSLHSLGQELLVKSLAWAAYFDGSAGASVANRIVVSDAITMAGSSRIDSFSAASGAYGGGNVGAKANVVTNSTAAGKIALSASASIKGDAACGVGGAPGTVITTGGSAIITGAKSALTTAADIPAITYPSLTLSPSNVTYSSGTTTLTSDFRCRALTISGSAILQISGDRTIVADNTITVKDTAQIKVLPGASLQLFGKRAIYFQNSAQVNVNTAKPSVCTIYSNATGTSKQVYIRDSVKVYATVVVPRNQLNLSASGQLCGSYLGKSLSLIDSSALSLDATATNIIGGEGGSTYTYTASWVEQP